VVASDLLDGGVLFDLNTKQYYQLNPSGFLVWRTLEAGADLAEAEARWLRNRNESGRDPLGLRSFVSALATFGLVEEGAGLRSGDPLAEPPGAWEAPRIEPHGSPLSEVILSPFDPTVPIPE
jgi:hypothetical protein